MVLGSRQVQTLWKRSRAELGDEANLWLKSSRALQPLWDVLWSARPWDLPVLPRLSDGGDRLPRKMTLEIPQRRLAPVFHLGCFSRGLSSRVLVCPADPRVLSSHIPVLASCCSLTKLNPPPKVPDALGPHTCLAPLGTCSPCPAPAAPAQPCTCSAPAMALQTRDSSYAHSLHLSQIFCPKYFFQCHQMSVLEPRSRPGSAGPVRPWDSSVNPVHGEVAVGTAWCHRGTLGSWKGSCSWEWHTQLLLMAVADCSPGGHHRALTVPCPWSCMHHPTHTIPHAWPHTLGLSPAHTQWPSLCALWCFSSPLPAHPEYIKTTCSDPDRLSVTVHARAHAGVTHPIVGCDMVWHWQHRHLQRILVPAQANSKLCTHWRQ